MTVDVWMAAGKEAGGHPDEATEGFPELCNKSGASVRNDVPQEPIKTYDALKTSSNDLFCRGQGW